MRIQNTPGSYGFLAGLIVMLLGLLVNASCDLYPAPRSPAMAATALRSKPEAMYAAVKIITECGRGSGVLIDDARVLTAHHVVYCEEEKHVSQVLAVELERGLVIPVKVDVLDPARDAARLRLAYRVTGIRAVKIAHATLGDAVCIYAAVPERATKCAKVDGVSGNRELGDVSTDHADVWYGNSGSGVYNSDGALVGLTVRLSYCSEDDWLAWEVFGIKPDHVCGARVTSLDDSPVVQ